MDLNLRERIGARAEAYGLGKLAKRAGLSRQALHKFLEGGDIRLSNLMSVLGVLNMKINLEQPLDDSDVLTNLKDYGAPVVAGETKTPLLPEETLVEVLRLARKDSRMASVLPFLMVKRAYQWDLGKLMDQLQTEVQSQQLLGYFTEVALAYRHRQPLEQLRDKLKAVMGKAQPLMLANRDQKKTLSHFRRFHNPAAKKWKLGTRDDLDSLVARCRKWEKLNATS